MQVPGQISDLEVLIEQSMIAKRHRFRKRLRQLQRQKLPRSQSESSTAKQSETVASQISKLKSEVESSVQLRKRRQDNIPPSNLADDLPVVARQQEIIQAVRDHQVVVISGETGSGKSTQIPPMLLGAGFGVAGVIGHTQPRRIAARGVAARIAEQLDRPLGSDVGFKIRFSDQTNPETYIKLMTDGILLAETQSDRFLEQYEVIIIDEAHERSLNIDFLLGYLKNILPKRPDLRLIITSATIDTARFADHFTIDIDHPVPIIEVEGRTYPVEIQYRPPELLDDGNSSDADDHLVSVCEELSGIDDGDMLVFLPTERDIRNVSKKLRSARLKRGGAEILPLYARLSTDQQNQIFKPGKARRIVLATNVAESSITVPRIRYVIDSGTARTSYYAARSKVQRLPIQAISQASANQRSGRCGRIGPGICVRLYSEDDYLGRPEFTTPEIRRTNLASVILQTLSLRLGSIDSFPFVDPPHPEAIRDGLKTLFEIGAVNERRELTPLGKRLAKMPVDPRIGKMIFAGEENQCLAEILVIAAALEIQDPRVRPVEKQKAADAQHEKFRHETSDFLSLLKLWDFFQDQKKKLSTGKLRKSCQQNFLSYTLMRQWMDIHRQLVQIAKDQKLHPRKRKDDFDSIHQSLMTGLLSGVALLTDRHEYTGAGNIKFHLWPGSGVFEAKPKWIIAAELVETSRRYGRTIAKISPQWIEPLARHLTKHHYYDPHWSQKQQTVMASENVTLFGVPIVNGRRIGYAKIDPEVSRDLLIDPGLVEDQVTFPFDFLKHNRWLLDEVKAEADKTRDRDLIVDRNNLAAFYQQTLPADVADVAALRRAIKADEQLDQRLRMTRADIMPHSGSVDLGQQFPNEVKIGSMEVPVDYRFEPGAKDDGASIKIPLEGIGQIDDVQTGWLVPGLLQSRIVALIRSLPKSVRRSLVPAPDTAEVVAQQLQFGEGRFIQAVAAELTRIGGLRIDETMFRLDKLDAHLSVNLQVVDESGEVIAQGRSIGEIRSQLGQEHVSNIVEIQDEQWQQDGLTEWNWGDFPREIQIQRGQTTLGAFPTIVDQQSCVGLRLSDSAHASDITTRNGLVRLFQLANKKALRSHTRWLPNLEQHSLCLARFVKSDNLKKDLADLMCRIGFVDREKIPRSRNAFDMLQSNAGERLSIAGQAVAKWLPGLSVSLQQVDLGLESLPERHHKAKQDIRLQIQELTSTGFLSQTPWSWLQQYPRYFEAIQLRMEKLGQEKDQASQSLIDDYWTKYSEIKSFQQTQAIVDPELIQYRWMIEEFRVSLFAQQLGTAIKVSTNRLDKQWAKIRKT